MAEVKIAAESRTEFGKGAARRIRRADKVPAVLYGRGAEPVHITLPGHDLMLALKNSNALLSIELDGKSQLALPKQVQRDPIKGFLEHVDLVIVRRGEKVTVDIRVHLTGEAVPEALVMTDATTLSVAVAATAIPESVEVAIDGMEPGSTILAKDVRLPEGSELQTDPDTLVVNVVAAPTAEEVEAELAEAEEDAGIERDESEAAAAEAGEGEGAEAADADGGESSTESSQA